MSRTLGDAFVRVRPRTNTFGAELQTELSGAGAQAGTATSTAFSSRFKSGMATAAKRGAIALTAGLVVGVGAFAKEGVKLEAEFGKTMNQLQASTGEPRKGMRELSSLAMKMGADTVFSASDASEAMLELARQGMGSAIIKAGALESSLTLAAAGGLKMERAATVMGNAMNAFNIEGSKSAKVASALAGAANASSASVDSIALGLQQFSAVAADSDQTVQGATGAIAALANAGIAGSDAGTSLKTMFARLIPSTNSARNAFINYGLSAYQAKGSMDDLRRLGIEPLSNKYGDVYKAISDYVVQTGRATEGSKEQTKAVDDLLHSTGLMQNAFVKQDGSFKSMEKIAGVLQDRFGKLSSSERAAALNTLFGSDARRAATILTREGEKGLARYIRATSDQAAAEKMAQASMKGTAGAIERRQGAVETATLAFGKAIKPVTMFVNNLVAELAGGAVPIIEDFGKKLRGLGKLDLSGIGDALKKVDVGAIFDKARNAIDGVNWGDVSGGFSDIGTALKDAGPALKDASAELPSLTDALKVGSTVIGFAADHTDTLAKALPALAAGFVIVKVAQLGANVAAAASPAIRLAEVFATRAQTKAIIAQTAALKGSSVAQVTNGVVTGTTTKATIGQRIAAFASAAATKAVAAATVVWTGVQKVLNLVLRANPIGLVITAVGLLVTGIVVAYQRSETFRKVVKGAFEGIAAAGRWMWNSVLQPVFKLLVQGIAWIMDKFGDMLETMSHVPGFGWAKGAADAMHNAADKANDLADGIKKIPPKKKVTVEYGVLFTGKAGSKAIANLLDKQANDPRTSGKFDSGGLATGLGYMPKGTIRPERVLSPRQTAAFERLVDNLDRQGGRGNVRGGNHFTIEKVVAPNLRGLLEELQDAAHRYNSDGLAPAWSTP